jgi:hypothetical protein
MTSRSQVRSPGNRAVARLLIRLALPGVAKIPALDYSCRGKHSGFAVPKARA